MFFFRKKKHQKKVFYVDSDQIFLCQGAFYFSIEKTLDETNTFTVIPGDDIPCEEFRGLALDCAANILSESPVVLNALYCNSLEPVEGTLSEDDCVKQYVAQGGTPIFVAKDELYTVSRGIDRQLVECVPEEAYGYYGFVFIDTTLRRTLLLSGISPYITTKTINIWKSVRWMIFQNILILFWKFAKNKEDK